MRLRIIILCIIAYMLFCLVAWEARSDTVGRATRAIIWVLRDAGARSSDYRILHARSFAHTIAPISRRFGVDIDAVIVTAYCESSFNMDAMGALGEQGLFQLHKRKMKNWRDLKENTEFGVRRLRQAIRTCTRKGQTSWEAVFGEYRSGRCNPTYGRRKGKLLRRLKKYLK